MYALIQTRRKDGHVHSVHVRDFKEQCVSVARSQGLSDKELNFLQDFGEVCVHDNLWTIIETTP